jgi:signal recognition particle GTPase
MSASIMIIIPKIFSTELKKVEKTHNFTIHYILGGAMKILRISEITKSSNGEKVNGKAELTVKPSSSSEDKVNVYEKSFIRGLLNEMKQVQEKASYLNAQIDALKELKDTLSQNPGNTTLSEEIKKKINDLIENKKFNNQKVLEDVSQKLNSANTKIEMLEAISEKLNEISSKLEELKKESTVIVLKASNLNQAIMNTSQSSHSSMISLINELAKNPIFLKNAQSINPDSVIRIISRNQG